MALLLKVLALLSVLTVTCADPCASVRCGYYGECTVQNNEAVCVCNTGCPRIIWPVCGSNGKTYDNECLLKVDSCTNKKGIVFAYEGQCKCDPCRNVNCGYHGVCEVQHDKPVCVCKTGCPRIIWPVCGSDGKTYDNECLLKVDSCNNKKAIVVDYEGTCDPCRNVNCDYNAVCKVKNNKPVCECDQVCTREYEPVCGSNGNTYSNKCLMKVDSCINKNHITVAYNGTCQDSCPVNCEYHAVCKDQNNKAACECNTGCPKIIWPVCGSNGKTYDNDCLLKLDSCNNKERITVAQQGRCDPCKNDNGN